MNDQPLLTPQQVAQRLQISPLTVVDYLRQGRLRGVKWGRFWRVREEDLDGFIQARLYPCHGTAPQPTEDGGC